MAMAGCDALDIDQDLARRLLAEGCFFVLLDFPVGSSIGIDLSDYSVGEKFRGFKMIPPGLHFIHYSAVNRKDLRQVAPKTGIFKYFNARDLLVLKWNSTLEDISDEPVSEDEIERFRGNLFGSLDSFLAPYPLMEYKRWVSLTNHISEDVLIQLNPICGRIKSVTQMVPLSFPHDLNAPSDASTSNNNNLDRESKLPEMKVDEDSQIRYSNFNKFKYPSGSTASEITRHSIDCTYCLRNVMKRYSKNDGILGELQFAFATLIAGHVYDSFDHWKAMLRLFCKSEEALFTFPELYLNFMTVLHSQLKEVPEEIFVDIVEKDNFLVAVLRDFFYNISTNESVNENLKRQALSLKESVTKKYKWDFDVEPDDESPVVVELA